MSYDSERYGTEHYRRGEVDAFKDGKRVDVDAVALRAGAVREREERHAETVERGEADAD